MPQLDFNFGNALTHFMKTGGPAGFFWKFVLFFLLAQLVLQGLSVLFNLPVYAVYLEMITNDLPAEELERRLSEASGASGILSLLTMPLSLLVWMCFEGANQRRYMRGDGFRLRLGNDEWRLLVVGLLWLAIIFAIYIVVAICVGAPLLVAAIAQSESALMIAAIVSILAGVTMLIGTLYIVSRLSAAAALTVRDESIRFFESWKVTKGRAWTLVGANLVLWGAAFILMILFYAGLIGIGFWQLAPAFEGNADLGDLASQPAFWVPVLMLCVLWLGLMAMLQHIMAGPAALAAKDDPSWVGNAQISQAFG